MIDGLLPPRRRFDNLHPRDREMANQTVVGDHSKDTAITPQGDNFVPPEEVAAAETSSTIDDTGKDLLQDKPPKPKRSLGQWFKDLSTKKKVLITSFLSILVAGAVIGAYYLFFTDSPPPPPAQKQTVQEEPKPTTVASNLTGLQVDPSVNERSVTAVMIENSLDARPQAGLRDAGVIFEAIAEGGITRFVALFQDTSPNYVGPVRSARPYYMQWMLGFDAAYAHAGGSAKALSYIKQWRVKDLPHHNSYFWRVSNRAAPHNLYTSIPKLWKYEEQKGFGKSNYTSLLRKASEEPATTPTAKTIDFNISSANFNVHYDYNAANNRYLRSEGGAKHKDDKSGKQLAPKVVIALIMPQGKDGVYYTYQTIGKGKAYIFQDGIVRNVTWYKDSNSGNFTFKSSSGDLVGLNPGQTWFTALGESNRVKYAP